MHSIVHMGELIALLRKLQVFFLQEPQDFKRFEKTLKNQLGKDAAQCATVIQNEHTSWTMSLYLASGHACSYYARFPRTDAPSQCFASPLYARSVTAGIPVYNSIPISTTTSILNYTLSFYTIFVKCWVNVPCTELTMCVRLAATEHCELYCNNIIKSTK